MSSRRTLILIGAVVIGGLAAFLTLNYVRGVENRSEQANELVDAVVVAQPIARGTSADTAKETEALTVDKRRRADLPQNYARRLAEVDGVAALNLSGGETVTNGMFVKEQDLSTTKAAALDKGNVAVTISVDDAAGVAGLIQPNDSVNISVRGILQNPNDPNGQAGNDTAWAQDASGGDVTLGKPATYLFQGVKVYAVGRKIGEPVGAATPAADGSTPSTTAATEGSGLITVQLPPEQAILLASLRDADIYLTLNRPDYEPVPVPFNPVVPGGFPGQQGVSPYPSNSEAGGQ